MNRITAGLLCLCIVSCTGGVKVKTDYERLQLRGKVKFISEIYFLPLISGDTVKRGERTSGESSFFESKGDEPFFACETKIYFDSRGNITECYMDDSATGFHFKEQFDYSGNLLKSKLGLLSGEFFYRETYRYDSKNREAERHFYDSEKHLFESVITEYPDKNTVIEKIHTENEHADFERETHFRNNLPVLSVSRVDAVRIIEKWSGEYDGNGRLILSKFYDGQDDLVQYEKYVYDEYDNELEYSIFSDSGELLAKYGYGYKYDGYGNWTQQVSVTDGQPEVITVRNIVYY